MSLKNVSERKITLKRSNLQKAISERHQNWFAIRDTDVLINKFTGKGAEVSKIDKDNDEVKIYFKEGVLDVSYASKGKFGDFIGKRVKVYEIELTVLFSDISDLTFKDFDDMDSVQTVKDFEFETDKGDMYQSVRLYKGTDEKNKNLAGVPFSLEFNHGNEDVDILATDLSFNAKNLYDLIIKALRHDYSED